MDDFQGTKTVTIEKLSAMAGSELQQGLTINALRNLLILQVLTMIFHLFMLCSAVSCMVGFAQVLRITNYELRIKTYELCYVLPFRAWSDLRRYYELRITNYELKLTNLHKFCIQN